MIIKKTSEDVLIINLVELAGFELTLQHIDIKTKLKNLFFLV